MRETRVFVNNIFYVDGRVTYRWGKSRSNVFEHNVFHGKHEGRPDDPFAITEKPPFVNPGSGRNGFDTLSGYKFTPGVPFPRAKRSRQSRSRPHWQRRSGATHRPCQAYLNP